MSIDVNRRLHSLTRSQLGVIEFLKAIRRSCGHQYYLSLSIFFAGLKNKSVLEVFVGVVTFSQKARVDAGTQVNPGQQGGSIGAPHSAPTFPQLPPALTV